MKKRVIVTGACGFVGRYMCEYLRNTDENVELIGMDVFKTGTYCDTLHTIDLSDAVHVDSLIKEYKPEYIIHLAGTFGTNNIQETYRTNVLSISALLESVRRHCPKTIVATTGSAAEYGLITPEQLPVTETVTCNPVTPYGLSKFLTTTIAQYYYRIHKINVMVVRPFQLIGKGVTNRLAPGAFAEQLMQAISNSSNIIKVGNLESSRDFLDVHDAVEAIWMLCQKPAGGEIFNLCSGQPIRMAELLDLMIACCGKKITIQVDTARLRGAADISVMYGNFAKIREQCGWVPHTSLLESITAMFSSKETS